MTEIDDCIDIIGGTSSDMMAPLMMIFPLMMVGMVMSMITEAMSEREEGAALAVQDVAYAVKKAVAEEKEPRRRRTLPLDIDTLDMLQEYIECGGPVATNGRQLFFGFSRGHAWRIIQDCAHKAGLGRLVNPETGQLRGISPLQAPGCLRCSRSKTR